MSQHPRKIGKVQTIDATTGDVLSEKRNAFTLLPAADGVCPECAVDHAHDQPHNQQSMYYQMRFHGTHGRWPTWTDALAHCPDDVKAHWRIALIAQMKKNGIKVPPDLMEQKPAGR